MTALSEGKDTLLNKMHLTEPSLNSDRGLDSDRNKLHVKGMLHVPRHFNNTTEKLSMESLKNPRVISGGLQTFGNNTPASHEKEGRGNGTGSSRPPHHHNGSNSQRANMQISKFSTVDLNSSEKK